MFFDPGKMADWIDGKNQSTHWKLNGLGYRDRGVDVRYDVPEPDPQPLDYWKTRNPYH